jgi:hypothetical protein
VKKNGPYLAMRKSLAIAAFIFTLCTGFSFAETFAEIPFVPLSPEVMGMGGAFVADTRGYNSFFYNPAGFSRDPGSFTLLDASSWIYSRPDQLFNLAAQSLAGTSTPGTITDFVADQVTGGGLGIGASLGIGYVGNGLGLGLVIIEDSLLYGQTLFGLAGDFTATVGFIGGLSVPFDVLGFKIHVGGDIRPMIRIHSPLSNENAIAVVNALASGGDAFAALDSAKTLYGAGIGLDLGAIAEIGWFTFGLSLRDLGGTQFKYNASTFGTVVSTFSSQFQFPAGSAVTADQYVIPMDIAFGIGFHPDMGSFGRFVDPSLSVDMHDLVGALAGTASVWTLLHAGAELKLISLFTVRAGLDQGYLTLGAGLKLLVLDINFAVFTRELGLHIGDQPNSGATLNLAIRW